jgi:hypothetical protein
MHTRWHYWEHRGHRQAPWLAGLLASWLAALHALLLWVSAGVVIVTVGVGGTYNPTILLA